MADDSPNRAQSTMASQNRRSKAEGFLSDGARRFSEAWQTKTFWVCEILVMGVWGAAVSPIGTWEAFGASLLALLTLAAFVVLSGPLLGKSVNPTRAAAVGSFFFVVVAISFAVGMNLASDNGVTISRQAQRYTIARGDGGMHFGHPNREADTWFRPQNAVVITIDWDAESPRTLITVELSISSFRVGTTSRSQARIWDVTTGKEVSVTPWISTVRFERSDQTLRIPRAGGIHEYTVELRHENGEGSASVIGDLVVSRH